ncbi:MAG: hypothetical protein HQL77_08915 [Magnetococcales bacterium]|nr:hypothetical protein [Magnetococcales bacterium]
MATPIPTPEPHPWIRVALLLLLPLLATLVWWDGQHYDPDVLQFAKGGNAPSVDSAWIPEKIGALVRIGKLRHYTKETLSDYVDGHADAYLAQGFKHLVVADYGVDATTNQPQLTVDVFDMEQPLNAFGMLMNETTANAKAVTIGAMGFAHNQALDFIQGGFLIKLTTFTPDQPLETWAAHLATPLTAKTGKSTLVFGFPDLGDAVSTRFIRENYHGLAFLRNVLVRQFKRGEVTFEAFLLTGSPNELAAVKKQLTEFLAREKITTSTITEGSLPRLVIHDPYEGDWFVMERKSQWLGIFGTDAQTLETPLKDFFQP